MNYFEYFSEIEERFVSRRGSTLLLSPLDWALIETWQEAGVPLPAVLRGIDTAFDRYEARRARTTGRLGKVNGLAWCAQAVMQAAAELTEASVGAAPASSGPAPVTGFEVNRIAAFLEGNAARLAELAKQPEIQPLQGMPDALRQTAGRLRTLAGEVGAGRHPALEELDRNLTVLEERLEATLLAALPEATLLAAREEVERELATVRSKLGVVQLRQMREQMLRRHTLREYKMPRLSLFYMPVGEG